MNYQAVILDIDGTLVPVGSAGVSTRVVECIRRLRQQGVKIIVATGRADFVLTPALLGDFTADYYICINGSLVTDATHRPVYERRLDLAQMEQLDRFAVENNVILAYTFEDYYYLYHGYCDYGVLSGAKDEGGHYVGDGPDDGFVVNGADGLRHQTSMPYGAVLHGVPEDATLPGNTGLSFVGFCPGSYDVYRADLDKACTARWLLDTLHIPMEACIAIGDGNNDVPMLRAAGLGIAMGNAREAVRAAADQITARAENDGVAVALDEIFKNCV